MGFVYEMDARTGGLLWKTPVGEHNGHDNDSRGCSTTAHAQLPYPIAARVAGGVLTNMAVAGGTVYVETLDLAHLHQP